MIVIASKTIVLSVLLPCDVEDIINIKSIKNPDIIIKKMK